MRLNAHATFDGTCAEALRVHEQAPGATLAVTVWTARFGVLSDSNAGRMADAAPQ